MVVSQKLSGIGCFVGALVEQHHGVTFDLGSATIFYTAIFGTYFSYNQDIWIASTDYFLYFYIIVLSPLKAILQLINFTASLTISLLSYDVILLLKFLF